jgi:hypothetical protein
LWTVGISNNNTTKIYICTNENNGALRKKDSRMFSTPHNFLLETPGEKPESLMQCGPGRRERKIIKIIETNTEG